MPGKAILIVDVQNDFTGDNARMPVDRKQGEQMMDNINKLLDGIDRREFNIIYIVNEYAKLDPLNIFRNFAAIKSTEGAKLDPKLYMVSNVCFSKHKGNAFSNPDLDAYLRSKSIDELFICGLFAGACVYATVKGALKNNYKVRVLTDCIAAASAKNREKAILKYQNAGAINMVSTAF